LISSMCARTDQSQADLMQESTAMILSSLSLTEARP